MFARMCGAGAASAPSISHRFSVEALGSAPLVAESWLGGVACWAGEPGTTSVGVLAAILRFIRVFLTRLGLGVRGAFPLTA